MVFFPWQNFLDRVLEFRTHAVATAVCTTVCEHTLTCCTHIFLLYIHCAHTSHILDACHTHAWLKGAKKLLCTCVIPLHVAFSSLIHFSPISAVLWHPLRHPSVHSDAVLTCPKSAGHAQLRTCIAKFGYRVKSDANTGYEPKKFDKITSVDDDTMLINDPNDNFSDFTKTTNENTRHFGVPTVFESSVSRVSHDEVALRIEAKESRQSGNRCQTERERKEKVLWSVLHCRCQRKVGGTILGVILFRLSENSIPMDEISENIFNEELDKLLLVKILFRENYTRLWRSKIQSEEVQNTHWLSHSVSLNLKENNFGKPVRASSTWENTFV